MKVQLVQSYVSDLKVLPHEEVEGGRCLRAHGRDGGGAVLEEPEAQVGAVLGGLVEEESGKLEDERPLDGEEVAEVRGGLVGAQRVQVDAQDARQERRGVVRGGDDLRIVSSSKQRQLLFG